MCILVVEDDFLIRMILVEELEAAGYEVKEAATGDEAVGILATLDRRLALLVTDVHMPGSLTGLDVAAHVQDRVPGVGVIFTTGRPDSLIALGALGDKQLLVRKPYIPSDIIEHIKGMLAA